jgi:hypothetical protein
MKIQIGIAPLIIIIFSVLKLTGVIAWSWWWVFSPVLIAGGLWIGAGLMLLLIANKERMD